MWKRYGFTLAEVLITLGIIGVVAALTIPTLITKYQEKQTVSKLTKAYAIINQAYALARIEHGAWATWFTEVSERSGVDEDGVYQYNEATIKNQDIFWDKLVPYLKVISECRASDNSCQGYDNLYGLTGVARNSGFLSKGLSTIDLTDGTTLSEGWVNSLTCDNNVACGDIFVDINGRTQGPNTFGKDVFVFNIMSESIKPKGGKDDISNHNFSSMCDVTTNSDLNGYGCAAWVIENKNMDYLKCDDLSWNGKHKCSQ